MKKLFDWILSKIFTLHLDETYDYESEDDYMICNVTLINILREKRLNK